MLLSPENANDYDLNFFCDYQKVFVNKFCFFSFFSSSCI